MSYVEASSRRLRWAQYLLSVISLAIVGRALTDYLATPADVPSSEFPAAFYLVVGVMRLLLVLLTSWLVHRGSRLAPYFVTVVSIRGVLDLIGVVDLISLVDATGSVVAAALIWHPSSRAALKEARHRRLARSRAFLAST